jgi:hypothetical protein
VVTVLPLAVEMATAKEASELKQQGVIEAAMDPGSSTTAADARKKIVDESQNAGVPVFNFDPNASPEQKKAQARAVGAELCHACWWATRLT